MRKQFSKKRIWSVLGLLTFLLLVMQGATVHAAPVLLESEMAVVYESADDGSNAVGNLIRGNAFELLERIQAEDGTLWYRIAVSNGVSGYIKGNALTKEAGKDSTAEHGSEAGSGNASETGAENANAENTDTENADTEDAEAEGTANAADAGGISEYDAKTLPKTYAVSNDSQRLLTDGREAAGEAQNGQSGQAVGATPQSHWWYRMDLAAGAAIAVMLISLLCLKYGCEKFHSVLSGKDELIRKTWEEKRKAKKRKKAKALKKKQAAKENARELAKEEKKWKNSNLQKK